MNSAELEISDIQDKEGVSRIVEISEWLDWMKTELPIAGIEVPCPEASVLMVATALRLADRAHGISRHLPRSIKSLLIESILLHQCWTQQKAISQEAKKICTSRQAVIRSVTMVRHVRQMDGRRQHQLMEGSDGFHYVVKLPDRDEKFALATEAICVESAKLMGLPVPMIVIALVDKELVKTTVALRVAFANRHLERGSIFFLGYRYIEDAIGTVHGQVPHGVRTTPGIVRDLFGQLVFDVLTLNPAVPRAVFSFDDLRGQFRALLIGQGGCLAGGDWQKFCRSALTDAIPPCWLAGRVRSLQPLNPWIWRAERIDNRRLWEIAFALPSEWYENDRHLLIRVLETLATRQWCLRRSLVHFIEQGYFENFRTADGLSVAPGS